MTAGDYLERDGVGLAELIRAREVSAEDLLEHALERISRANPNLNAITWLLDEQARQQIGAGLPDGPFRGVPFLVKDHGCDVAGTVTTSSCRFFLDRVAGSDSTLVRRFRQGGLVFVGRTNTPELAIGSSTEPAMFGATRNPWSPKHIAGGSSGGSAAAVAAGIVPMAHGNDAGGSIRIPASCCGLVGLKPTRGRNPPGASFFESMGGLNADHVLTTTVRDTAAMLDLTAGREPGTPYRCQDIDGTFLAATTRPPRALKIALMGNPLEDIPVDKEVEQELIKTARVLEGLGHTVEPVAPELDAASLLEAFAAVAGAEIWTDLDQASAELNRPILEEYFEPATWVFLQSARFTPAVAYAHARRRFHEASRLMSAFHAEWDILLSPTLATPPILLGITPRFTGDWETLSDRSADGDRVTREDSIASIRQLNAFTPFANITGQPSLSLPLGRTSDERPIGMLLTADIGREDVLLGLAAQIENAQPWPRRAPASSSESTTDAAE